MASPFATNLCNMVGTDSRSQFYKTSPTRESSPTSEPPYSLGKEKIIKSQKFFASRRQTGAIGDKKEAATTSPLAQASAPSPNQDQGRLDTKADSLEGQGRPVTNAARSPTHKETDVIPHDNNLFYKNGNPKPNLPARPLPRGLTSKARKCQGGRNRNRRRNRRGRQSGAAKELYPTTTERAQGGDEPTQTGSDAIPLPLLQGSVMLRELPVELEMEAGAACFGPHTALLIQDPLNFATHAPVETFTRPIGWLKQGDTVLAEKHGPERRGKFFLAKVKCVMTFEIPQAMHPEANRVIQDNILSTGLGFTLTKHHHTRNFGHIRCDTQGRWQLATQMDDIQWKVAADLARYPTRTRKPCSFPVTRVFNLVLDPPGNVVILTPTHKIYLSATLGYHMRYENNPDDRSQQTGGIPVYTRGDALQLQDLPGFG